jgi:hypothetical protein
MHYWKKRDGEVQGIEKVEDRQEKTGSFITEKQITYYFKNNSIHYGKINNALFRESDINHAKMNNALF